VSEEGLAGVRDWWGRISVLNSLERAAGGGDGPLPGCQRGRSPTCGLPMWPAILGRRSTWPANGPYWLENSPFHQTERALPRARAGLRNQALGRTRAPSCAHRPYFVPAPVHLHGPGLFGAQCSRSPPTHFRLPPLAFHRLLVDSHARGHPPSARTSAWVLQNGRLHAFSFGCTFPVLKAGQ
jgi:hypothetical protein